MYKNTKLNKKVWIFLTIFSCLILIFLWFFQVVFLKSFYKFDKTREINKLISKIKTNYNEDDFSNYIEELSFKNDVCIIITGDINLQTRSHACMMDLENKKNIEYYEKTFESANNDSDSYTMLNPRFKNETLINAFKLNSNTNCYLITSLEPLDLNINILSKQFIFVTIIVFLLSFIIGYFISKKISKPIVKMNELANNLEKRKFDFKFDENTGIEELNELAHTLNKAVIEISKSDELQREFLANITHDLKTPLTMIEAYAEMVRDITYNNTEKREQNLNVIIDESKRLNLLVNDILELSRMQAGISELKTSSFDIVELIKNIINKFDILTQKENYEFIFDVNQKINVIGDEQKIEQVIYNLINNAINYTGDDKKVYIFLDLNKDTIKINIKDTGIGIEEDKKDLVWRKYFKSDKKHKRNQYGTGLGLSIVKSILEAHKSTYGFTSKKNKGTTFYFTLKRDD
ncbi:MAG: HAMP domain-containing histidine kinase [Bacilli bacterium]|nr:HAMP domain-containing histidine kinase [Bacilli bacterium]